MNTLSVIRRFWDRGFGISSEPPRVPTLGTAWFAGRVRLISGVGLLAVCCLTGGALGSTPQELQSGADGMLDLKSLLRIVTGVVGCGRQGSIQPSHGNVTAGIRG